MIKSRDLGGTCPSRGCTTKKVLVAAVMVGHAGEELVHVLAFAMKFEITPGQIRDAVYAFPTFCTDIKRML